MKNTKKLMVVLLALMLVLSFTLAACGDRTLPVLPLPLKAAPRRPAPRRIPPVS